ncbi:hypothetical protein MMC18_000298 [Xylographa bjoerkii]|nr:hypothetical protein [Xylographa bjoerkii]
MPRLALYKWPLQVPSPEDFSIAGLESPLQAFHVPGVSRDLRDLNDGTSTIWGRRDLQSTSGYSGTNAGDNYAQALDRWRSVGHSIHGSDEYLTSLPRAQRNSYKILDEWWNNDAYDSSLTVEIREWIQRAAGLRIGLNIQPRLSFSRYNLVLFTLWHAEFGSPTLQSTSVLYSHRQMAASEAACRRLASRSAAVSSKLKQECREFDEPRANPFGSPLDAKNNPMASLPANIEPCHWIIPDEESSRLPYYLWDRIDRVTVVTEHLDSPAYTAISHTWGRWQIQPYTSQRVSGVPWSIPKNTLFDVVSLPYLMTQIPSLTRYIWLDLLCIPQSMSDPIFGPRARIEIANQAAIFRSASFAIAWLNVVPQWSGLLNAVEWLAAVYVGCNKADSFDLEEPFMEMLTLEANKITYLLSYPSSDSFNDARPSGWFTSLWTLQEVCLRPDMLLCDKDWRLLSLSSGFNIPIDHIVALWTSTYEAIARHHAR